MQIANTRCIDTDRMETGRIITHAPGIEEREYIGIFEVTPEGWNYIFILVIIGIVLLILARLIYKKRHLECAGDLLSERWLEGPFQVVFTVLCSAGIHGLFMVFFGLSRARRLTMMGNAYTGGSAKDTLMDLLREGPENGMNFIVWANSVEGFNDHYAAAMGLFEHRLVGNIGEDDYKTFLGESAPRSMSNNNAVYFNADALDSPKVRLYSSPTQNWINDFLSAAERWQ
jgi:hypothetical protein